MLIQSGAGNKVWKFLSTSDLM